MLWQPDLARYPLVLCGPILRRVTPTEVAVFVVLTEHRWVQLRLYQGPSPSSNDNPTHLGPILDPVRLGEHFYVALATIDAAGTPLEQGEEYAYNVIFHDQADGSGSATSLADPDLGLLAADNVHRIGFAADHLPSFVVPPGDLTELRVLQGSCRKPHGLGIDMLASMDDLVADGNAASLTRPHLLVLGGDQIYADDVSPNLLRMIHDASQLLIGWDEVLDGTGPQQAMAAALESLKSQVAAWLADWAQQANAWADTAGKELMIDLLAELVDLLDDAAQEATFSDNSLKNEITRFEVRAALALFRVTATNAIGELDVPTVTPDQARDAVAALVKPIAKWLNDYEQLFLPLATNREWGHVAVMRDPADLPTLAEVGERLDAVAQSSTTDPAALLDALAAAFDPGPDNEFTGAEAKALAGTMVDLAASLVNDAILTAGEVKDLAIQVKEHFFPGEAKPYQPSRISAPQRGLELKQFASMTSDAMNAHLMFFGEFLLMYVFAWSDAVWPQVGSGSKRRFVLPPHFESVPNYGLTGPLGPSGLADDAETLTEFAAGLPKVRRVLANVPTLMMFDDHEITDDWNLNEDWVRKVNTTAAGSQLLRNGLIAYGIFQDWGNKPEDYLDIGAGSGRPIGRRLLDAVTYDPADPSDPADAGYHVDSASAAADPASPRNLKPPRLYRDTDSFNLNSTVAEVNWLLGVGPQQVTDLETVNVTDWLDLSPKELAGMALDGLLTEDEDEVAYRVVPDQNRMRWDWSYDIPAVVAGGTPSATERPVRVIALDTRTRRAFPDSRWAVRVGLEIDGTATIDGKVAASTLINGAELSHQLDSRLGPDDTLHLVISPAPVFGLPLVENVFQRLQVLASGPEVADFEAWQANPHGFGMLLSSLRLADCVLISGDVHYGYSNLITFPETESPDGAVVPARLLLQLCSSSMKNETGLTMLLGAIGHNGRLTDFAMPALGEIGQMIAASFLDLGETLGELGGDLSNFGTWYAETAPILPFSAGALASYYLKLKDTMLYSIDLPNRQGLVSVGQELIAYLLGEHFGPGPGQFEYDGFRMHFLSDDRSPDERLERAAGWSGASGSQVIAAIAPDPGPFQNAAELAHERLGEMAEVVGYNNSGLITFVGPGTASDDIRHELLWHPHGADNEPFEPPGPDGLQIMATTRHGLDPPLASLPHRIAEMAEEEYLRWNPPSGRIDEDDEEGKRILHRYKNTLLQYDQRLQELAGRSIETFEIPNHAWSAIFISYVMHRAQAGPDWLYSQLHIDYARAAFLNRVEDNDNPFRLYRRDQAEAVVQVGDVVGGQTRSRPPGTTADEWDEGVDDANVSYPLHQGKYVATHFDIVVAVNDQSPRKAWIVGGNVDDKSDRKEIPLDDEGRLTPYRYGLIRAEVR